MMLALTGDGLACLVLVAAMVLGLVGVAATIMVVVLRRKNMHLWLREYCFPSQSTSQRQRNWAGKLPTRRGHSPAGKMPTLRALDAPVHVFIAVCDHFEPEWGQPGKGVALERVRRWRREYPERFAQFADCRGRVPQHTFFFPQDQYAPEYLDLLAELCQGGFGDVDVHLHHDRDTEESLREKLEEFRDTLSYRHGLLRHDPLTGRTVYGFIHGNWALCNSRPDGRWCGVNREIEVLRETGCYADFTMPSAPAATQTRTINSIYYAVDQPGKPKSHDRGVRAEVGKIAPPDSLLMIQGPLVIDWRTRKWGALPRIENGDLHAGRPASKSRLEAWMKAGVHVAGRPDWLFVKLHTHGCKVGNIDMLLGEPTQRFDRELAEHAAANRNFRYYYVTAWEMAQLVRQAEQGAAAPRFNAALVVV